MLGLGRIKKRRKEAHFDCRGMKIRKDFMSSVTTFCLVQKKEGAMLGSSISSLQKAQWDFLASLSDPAKGDTEVELELRSFSPLTCPVGRLESAF